MNDSASAAVAAGSKLAIGGTTIAAVFGLVLSMVVVMMMTLPRTVREWFVGLISTATASLAGGAWVAIRFGLVAVIHEADRSADFTTLYFALIELFGIVFLCGLPGWLLVRAGFLYMERNRDKDLGQLVDDVKAKI